MPRRLDRRLFGALTVITGLACVSCETKPPEVYELPAGFRGWVEIRANRGNCPPLRVSAGKTMFTIPANGVLCTSTPIAAGMGKEEFYYVQDHERTRLRSSGADPDSMIWNLESYGSDGTGPDHERLRDRIRFFVGTRAEYEAARTRAQ